MVNKFKYVALIIGILMVALLTVLWSGWPQKIMLTASLEKILGAEVELIGGHYGRNLSWESIAIYPPDDLEHVASVAVFDHVTITYDFSVEDGRNIPDIHIDSIRLSPDNVDPEAPNYHFFLDLLAAESTTDDLRWVPRTITVDELSIDGRWPEGTLSLSGIQVEVICHSLSNVGVAIHIQEQQESSHVVSGDIKVEWKEEQTSIEVRDFSGMLQGTQWMPLFDYFMPESGISFEAIEFAVSEAQWTSSQENYPTGTMDMKVQGLELMQSGEMLFTGAVEGEIVFTGGESPQSIVDLRINQGLKSTLTIALGETSHTATLALDQWTKENLLAVLPSELQSGIKGLPFKKLGGTFYGEWNEVDYSIEGSIASETKTIDIDLAVHGKLDSPSSILGEIDARVGDGILHASGKMDDQGFYLGKATLKKVPLRPFALLAAGVLIPESMSGVLNGVVTARQQEGNYVTISPRITVQDLHYDAMKFEPISIESVLVLDSEARRLRADKIVIQTEDESILITAKALDVNVESGDLSIVADYMIPLDALAVEGLYGTMAGSARVNKKQGVWTVPVHFTTDYIGYGEWTLPYGTELTGEGVLRYRDETQGLDIRDAHMKLGEGTLIVIPKATLNEAGWTGTTDIDSDLTLLVDMAYVDSVDGVLQAKTTWSMKNDALTMDWKTSANIAKMVMPEKAATVVELQLEAEGRYGSELNGEGTISMESVRVAGATLKNFKGPIRFEKNVLVIPESSVQVFNGTLASRIDLRVMEEGFPLDFKGTLKEIDLAQLTKEVEPPKTKLTGEGHGTVEAHYTLSEGLVTFDLNVESEKDFTVNRSLVEELLQMQTVLKGLGEKKAKRAMDKFLGKAEQRPFDTAKLHVFLLDGSVLGFTELRSEKTKDYNGLNLRIQLDIDKSALVQSLKMLEESSLAEMEF